MLLRLTQHYFPLDILDNATKTSPSKLHTLQDDLAMYILGLATESKLSPVEFRKKVLIKLLTGNDATNKISNRVLDQWLNKKNYQQLTRILIRCPLM